MPLKTYKLELLGRTCISTVVELPVTSEFIYVPKENETITQVSISGVEGHDDIIGVAMIIATDTEEPLIEDLPDA